MLPVGTVTTYSGDQCEQEVRLASRTMRWMPTRADGITRTTVVVGESRRRFPRPWLASLLILAFAATFLLGRAAAPERNAGLIGSLARTLAVQPGSCVNHNATSAVDGVQMPVVISWQSAWKKGEYPFKFGAFTSDVHVGLAWDRTRWPFVSMSVTSRGRGWSAGNTLTPAGKAAERWSIGQARYRGLAGAEGTPSGSIMEQLSPSAGVWVLENFYSSSPRATWTATFFSYSQHPKPLDATIALIDRDGSIVEKTTTLNCP